MGKEALALIAALTFGDGDLEKILKDPRTEWYDSSSVVQVMQRDGFVYRSNYGDGSRNPNNHAPWIKTGGTDNVAGLKTIKFRWQPRGTKIVYWWSSKPTKSGGEAEALVWSYPVGTVFGELLIHDGRVIEIRTRRRKRNDWERLAYHRDGNQMATDNQPVAPPGYKVLSSCVQCHEDTGVHGSFRNANWRGFFRGSDGILSWSPLVAPEPGFRMEPVLRDEVKDIVRARREGESFDSVVEWLSY